MSPSPLRHPARLAGASLLRLQSDERLAELAASGHEAAFDAIVDRYRTPLTRYCAGIVGPSRADDAVQQTLINAHDALKRTDEVRHLRSWLYRIAHNAALNVLRAVRDDVSLDAAAGAAVMAEAGPDAAFERSERFRATVAALQELPERQRAALVLRELEGRSHEEIAETLGVTAGSARQHLMRARVALRTAVTAITPYPLIVRLAEALAGPSSAGWTDAAVGAGAGATLAKLTAGVVATGALVGGAVGTERVVHHHGGQAAAERSSGGAAAKTRAVKDRAVSLPAAGGAGPSAGGSSGSGAGGSGHAGGKGEDGRGDDHGGGRGGSNDSGTDGRGSDDSGSVGDDKGRGSGSSGPGGGSGSTSGSGSSGGSDDNSGRHGSSGSGSKGSDDSGQRGSSGSGSSDSGTSGSGSSSSGSSGSGTSGSSSGTSGSGSSSSGRGGKGSDDNSGSGSGRGSGDDSSGSSNTTAAPVPEPAPAVVTTTPSTTTTSSSGDTSGSGDSGTSGDDGSESSGRSGSN
jgi:RNA polymerase sigma factor (sigma-70 family)